MVIEISRQLDMTDSDKRNLIEKLLLPPLGYIARVRCDYIIMTAEDSRGLSLE